MFVGEFFQPLCADELFRNLFKIAQKVIARIVDQDIDTSETIQGGVDGRVSFLVE